MNERIVAAVFSGDRAGEPVHLDLDDSVVEGMLEPGESSVQDFVSKLIKVVCSISHAGTPESVFGVFTQATRRWNNLRKNDSSVGLETPPALALLGLLSLAAEQMHSAHDDEIAITAGNFYDRFAELMQTDGWNSDSIQHSYRDVKEVFVVNGAGLSRAIGLWRSLQDWLDAWQDERGVCTVSFPVPGAGGNWAIAMPVSQALLREVDRDNLRKMFALRGLDPTVPVSPEMMERLLDEWCRPYGTNHLKTLWKNNDLRESVIGGSIQALLSWSGVDDDLIGTEKIPSLGIGLTVDLNAFSRRVDIGIEVRAGTMVIPEIVHILDIDGTEVPTRVNPFGPRIGRVADYSVFDPASLVSGVLRVVDKSTERMGIRHPKPVVAFLASSAGNSYSEVSSTTLSARHGVLVRERTDDGHDLLADVTHLLEQVARPGWKILDSSAFKGLPNGWVFIQNVELVTVPTSRMVGAHLLALAPIPDQSMSLSSGFRVPGRRERWLTSAAPEILVTFPFEVAVSIEVSNLAGDVVGSTSSECGVAMIKLAELGLGDGIYTVSATTDEGGSLSKIIYLVSADTANPSTIGAAAPLWHPLDKGSPFGVISARSSLPSNRSGTGIRGLVLTDLADVAELAKFGGDKLIPVSRPWAEPDDQSTAVVENPVRIEPAPQGSCLYMKHHHFVIPTAMPGPQKKFTDGQCKYCGFTRTFRNTLRVRRISQRGAGSRTNSNVEVAAELKPLSREIVQALPPIETSGSGLWDRAFEAICYLRVGTSSDLAYIVGQIAGGGIGVDRIVRSLSVLGHVDVELDERCRPERWSVSPSVVVVTDPGRAHLAGFRSDDFILAVVSRVEQIGGSATFIENGNAPFLVELRIPEAESFGGLLGGILDPITNEPVVVQESATHRLLAAMPTISEIGANSPAIPRPPFRKINKWDGKKAIWVAAESDLDKGSYQHIGYGYVYTHHPNDIEVGAETLSGTASTVKHLESLRAGNPLIFYSPETRVLCTRLGAELPGLFGRAVVAQTGRLPFEDEVNHLVKYHNVDEITAQAVHGLLRS